MSDDKKRIDINSSEFFFVESVDLRVGQIVPFDCFVHLQKNGKAVHWMREGSVFTVDRREKLAKLGHDQVLVMEIHHAAYRKYMGLAPSDGAAFIPKPVAAPAPTPPPPPPTPVTVQEAPPAPATDPMAQPLETANSLGSATGDQMKFFGGIKMSRPLAIHIKGSGAATSEAAAPKPAVSAKMKIDVDFLNAVIKATQEVFQERFLIPITYRAPSKRTQKPAIGVPLDVASFVGLTSQSIRGTIGLCFPTSTYLYLLCQATGTKYEKLIPELYTGCGEFMQFIFETARGPLTELGYNLDHATPTLVVGRNLALPYIFPDQGFSIVFESPGGLFQFEIGLKSGS